MERRKKPFTEFERSFILNLIQQNSAFIENKKTDSITTMKKNATWQKIVEEYNASPRISHKVDIKQLKKFWYNIKMKYREAVTQKNKKKVTDGGSVASDMDPESSLVLTPHLLPVIKVTDSDENQSEQDDDDDSQYWVHVKRLEEDEQVEPPHNGLTDTQAISSPENMETPEHVKPPCSSSVKRRCSESSDHINVGLWKSKFLEQDYHHRQIKFDMEIQHLKKLQEIELKLKERELTHKSIMFDLYEEEMKLNVERIKTN